MTVLDTVALNIELVLISIIEALALGALATNSIKLFSDGKWEYIPFILAGMVILLVFWAQAILHAVSFIRWPLSMSHMFTYFIAAFLQVVAYNNITVATAWFFWWTLFSIFTLVMYLIDYRLLWKALSRHMEMPAHVDFLEKVTARHRYEMVFLVPLSIMFNVGFLFLSFHDGYYFSPMMFIFFAGCVQLLVSLGALIDCVENFNKRSVTLEKLMS